MPEVDKVNAALSSSSFVDAPVLIDTKNILIRILTNGYNLAHNGIGKNVRIYEHMDESLTENYVYGMIKVYLWEENWMNHIRNIAQYI